MISKLIFLHSDVSSNALDIERRKHIGFTNY